MSTFKIGVFFQPLLIHNWFSTQYNKVSIYPNAPMEANTFLLTAAKRGLFPTSKFFRKSPPNNLSFDWFEKRPYLIRHPQQTDLPVLLTLEAACWAKALQASLNQIEQRLKQNPNGHFVLEMDRQVVGIIYSQQILAIDVLKNATSDTVSTRHSEQGNIIQLLSLNILPTVQDLGLGDQLLEFMLQYCTVTKDVNQVVAITRCKSYSSQATIPIETYIHTRNTQGFHIDPILRFHEAHGATVEGLIPQYRPNDIDNQGYGVLIAYHLAERNLEYKHIPKSRSIDTVKTPSANMVNEIIRSIMPPQKLQSFSPERPLMEMGLDSLDILELRLHLNQQFKVALEPMFFFQYSTPKAISHYFQGITLPKSELTHYTWPRVSSESVDISVISPPKSAANTLKSTALAAPSSKNAIAIIGMACRFPNGANSPEQYWSHLRNGIDTISEVPPTRWDIHAYYSQNRDQPGKIATKYGGFLDQVDLFDAQFFRIAPREATYIDPQHRILLELSWTALENAGLNPVTLSKSQTGVFMGLFSHDYETLLHKQNHSESFEAYFVTGNSASAAAGRLSYFYGFQGPAIAIDTACSSSLVAIHLACQSLHNQECTLALAGGVNLLLSPNLSIIFSKSGMLAPDGRCKTFDASADGYVRSEGAGVIILKSLADAMANNDPILAVIQGSAINQDGTSAGLTAPSQSAQEAVIQQALSMADVAPHQVSYVEAHGTGTSLGDPIEFKALEKIYGQERTSDNPLTISSVKTNIGHTEAAAGVAGLIKTVLALQHEFIPPHLHLKQCNPHIHLEHIPAVIPTSGQHWFTRDKPRFAGISSFGFSGTNAHLILTEAPPLISNESNTIERPIHLLTLSAKNEVALRELAQAYGHYFHRHPQSLSSLANICFTSNSGRAHFNYRLALIAESKTQMRTQVQTYLKESQRSTNILPLNIIRGKTTFEYPPKITFLFTGQGSQYIGMGWELYQNQPTFRKTLNRCAEILDNDLEIPLLDVLYPGLQTSSQIAPKTITSLINETAYSQPALFTLEYALAKLWQSWGITPDVVMGHSVGEYVAACVAGVFSLEDGLKLIAERGRLMQALPQTGQMIAVFANEDQVINVIAPYANQVSIAAFNGPQNLVISGLTQAIKEIEVIFRSKEIKTRKLSVTQAFHSPLMEPILAEFEEFAANISYTPPQIPLISNITGHFVTVDITTPKYWSNHIRQPVKFTASMETLHQQAHEIFVETGPKPTLLGLGRRCLPEANRLWLPSLRQGKSDWQQILQSLGHLYVRGVMVDWAGFEQDYVAARQRVVLPTYPFQRKRYWLKTSKKQHQPAQTLLNSQPKTAILDFLNQGDTAKLASYLETEDKFTAEQIAVLDTLVNRYQQEIAAPHLQDWLYEVVWRPQPLQNEQVYNSTSQESTHWLIFADDVGFGNQLADLLKAQSEDYTLVFSGKHYKQIDEHRVQLNPANPTDFEQLLTPKKVKSSSLYQVIHLWSLNTLRLKNTPDLDLEIAFQNGCGSILHLTQTLLKANFVTSPNLWLITRDSQAVGIKPALSGLAQSPVWGLGKVIALEHPELNCIRLDLDPTIQDNEVQTLLEEIQTNTIENEIAYRNKTRYVARLAPKNSNVNKPILKNFDINATYFIIGGLGGLGLLIARWMAKQNAKYLVLMGRSGAGDKAQEVIKEIEQMGTLVTVVQGDVSQKEDVNRVLKHIKSTMPPLQGVFHLAAVLEDGALLNQTWSRFQKVMRPKIDGTWHLHTLLQNEALDFCIFFSSAVALLGSPGLGNYSAANTFLDALAHYRQAQGLNTLSINWGAWSEVGIAVAHNIGKESVLQSMGTIPPQQGLLILTHLMQQAITQIGVLSTNWAHYLQKQVLAKPIPLLFELTQPYQNDLLDKQTIAPDLNWLEQIKESPIEQREDILLAYLKTRISSVLALELPDTLQAEQLLSSLGFDSLMNIDLKNLIAIELAVNIPLEQFVGKTSIAQLANLLFEKLTIASIIQAKSADINLDEDLEVFTL